MAVAICERSGPSYARRSFIEEISARDQGNKYVRIGICEFEYSDRDYLLVESLEYFMESVNPCVYVYRSYFSPDSFLECMDSFNYLLVLEEGEYELSVMCSEESEAPLLAVDYCFPL